MDQQQKIEILKRQQAKEAERSLQLQKKLEKEKEKKKPGRLLKKAHRAFIKESAKKAGATKRPLGIPPPTPSRSAPLMPTASAPSRPVAVWERFPQKPSYKKRVKNMSKAHAAQVRKVENWWDEVKNLCPVHGADRCRCGQGEMPKRPSSSSSSVSSSSSS